MLIPWNPTKIVSEVRTCPFHQDRPGESFAGCTCSASTAVVPKPPEEWTEADRVRYETQLPGRRTA